MKAEIIKHIEARAKNKRFVILLMKKENEKFFLVHTKTLQDFKTRNITETRNVFSVESFYYLATIMFDFIESSEIRNKILNREISGIKPINASKNFK